MHPLIGATVVAALLAAAAPAAVGHDPARATAEPGFVTGTVVDRHGDPLPGVLVNALSSFEVPERGVLEDPLDRAVFTDDQGRFRVQQPPGGYLLQICTPEPEQGSGHRAAAGREEADDPTCVETVRGSDFAITYDGPDGVTDSWLTQHHLHPSTGSVVDAGTIQVRPAGTVHGRLRGARAGEVVSIMRLNDTDAYQIETDARGDFRLPGMVPGRYYLTAGGDGSLPWRSSTVRVTPYGDTTVDGVLRRGATVTGRLVDAAGRGEPAEVLVTRAGKVVAVADTDAQGRYRIAGLRPGVHRVGLPFPDGRHLPVATEVRAGVSGSVVRVPDLEVSRGGIVRIGFVTAGRQSAVVDELRDSRGVPVRSRYSDGRGHAVYEGLAPGTYHAVAALVRRYGRATVVVPRGGGAVEATVRLDRPTLTLRGRTAPRATVSLSAGQPCPPGADEGIGAFFVADRADASGRYVLHGVVPGRFTLRGLSLHGYTPRCRPDVAITRSTTLDLPLARGATVSGRYVYAGTHTPLITELGFQLQYARSSTQDPAGERPAVGRSRLATGRFAVSELRPGRATGFLASETGEDITDGKFVVVFPYQDGTPYWYAATPRQLQVPGPGRTLALGDVELSLQGAGR